MHIRHLAVIQGKTDIHTCKNVHTHTHTKIHIQYNNDQQDSTGVSAGLGQHRGMKGRNNEADFSAGETGGEVMEWNGQSARKTEMKEVRKKKKKRDRK